MVDRFFLLRLAWAFRFSRALVKLHLTRIFESDLVKTSYITGVRGYGTFLNYKALRSSYNDIQERGCYVYQQ